jgi:DNA-binding LytR/AlgR family response regulator
MREIKAIIADDEEQLCVFLKRQLADAWPDLVVCGQALNGKQALKLIKEHQPDIAFLDIKMPGLSGLEVAKKVSGICNIVFITAYDQYAVEAFERQALDYILKPVGYPRLEKMVKHLKKHIIASSEPAKDISEVVGRIMEGLKDKEKPEYLQWLRVQKGDSIQLIPVDDICYFKAQDKYTVAMAKKGESTLRKPIKELVDELDPDKFWRIHRGTIVNVASIAKVSPSLTGRFIIKLKDRPEILTASRTYTHLFKHM